MMARLLAILILSQLLLACSTMTQDQKEATDAVVDTVVYRLLYLVSP